ncbi:MAG: carbohydrate kinase family protein [Gammaproteobacteria bacterium]|nr:carbohydrate kinase family protein [Gammaproteobacteria bacterium]
MADATVMDKVQKAIDDVNLSEPISAPVLAIGAAGIDVLGRQARDDPGADSVPGVVQRAPGGVARNIAESLAHLGLPVKLISLVGSDGDGDWLLDATARAGVDVSLVQRSAALPSPTYLAVHNHRGHMTAAVSDMRLCESLGDAHLQPLGDFIRGAAALVVDTNLTPSAMAWLAERRGAVPLFADAVSTAKASRLQCLLGGIHTLKLNLPEARALSERPRGDWQGCAEHLLEQGVQRVIVSLGEAGIGYSDARQRVQKAAPRCPVDTDTGAGDALTAGLVAAWVRGLPLTAQLDYALACAGVTLRSATAVQPALSVATVSAWIEEYL